MNIRFNEEVADAIAEKMPIVALESTVIAHGLPHPHNIETAKSLENIVRDSGAIPATIAVFGGVVHVGLDGDQIEKLATGKNIRKISRRDIPVAIGQKLDCATTVATTSYFAHRAGIRVFSTGGIGGVHRGHRSDISADLPELARTPITVICSGAKIVLDLPSTREWLETHGITVVGWNCTELPAFYSRSSGLDVDASVGNAAEAVKIITARDQAKLSNAILLCVPVPEADEIDITELETILEDALDLAKKNGIGGKDVTPFLLSQMSERSRGRTLTANISLLENNARVASAVAIELGNEYRDDR